MRFASTGLREPGMLAVRSFLFIRFLGRRHLADVPARGTSGQSIRYSSPLQKQYLLWYQYAGSTPHLPVNGTTVPAKSI